ncbi:odorant receptor 46a-like [Achroia grisella]|uniref:odorant receptor 46a-like n=1 Tax=Achroia grisella TaxID=688607 RepID=UPI0027D2E843|nr:odorant receptor 46a-like [Achroia grisella]
MAKYSVLEAFAPHIKALARVAYYKIPSKDESTAQRVLYEIYRFIMWFFIILYNLQHLIHVVQVRYSTDQIVNTLFILLTTLNCFGKQITFNARSGRLKKIFDIIEGPLFAPTNPYHLEVMRSNAVFMARLIFIYHAASMSCAALWLVYPVANRALGNEVIFTGYVPFDTSESPLFEVAVGYFAIVLSIQAYGHVAMDSMIIALYRQATVQIKLLRYNLEHLMDVDGDIAQIAANITKTNKEQIIYKDNMNDAVNRTQRRIVKSANHYKEIVSYIKEVESIFNGAMIIQFFVMAWVICTTVYKIVLLNILSPEFIPMVMYLGCMLGQLFLFCYFGSELKVESEFISQSVYTGDWLALSPSHRRELLLLMCFCSRPLAPRTAYIIPMSLDTYIGVLKSSYSLFTVLNR